MRRTFIAILAVIGTVALVLGGMIWDDERIKKHNLELAHPAAAAAGEDDDDPGRLVLLKTEPPQINSVGFPEILFSATNTSARFLKVVWVACTALDNETVVEVSAAIVPNIKQNETAYGQATFMKTKNLNLHFKCRISQVLG
jgi:hypothetical protein